MHPRRLFLLTLLAFAPPLVASPHVEAQSIVFDPTNHVENALQAARQLETLANQARQLANEARMLARSPLSQAGDLGRALASVEELAREVKGLTTDAVALRGQFRDLYGGESGAAGRLQSLERSLARLSAARDTAYDLVQLAAALGEAGTDQQRRTVAALSAAEAADGQTAAVQSSAQLLGLLSEQLTAVQALMAGEARLAASEAARAAADREAALETHRRLWAREPRPPTAPAFSPFPRAGR